jgi:plasmid replication initiation protein
MEYQEYETINGRKVFKKHVATIHCSGKLTLMERKIANVLLYKALPELKQCKKHHITLDELKRLLGKVTRNHELLKKSIKTLISTVIEWNLCDDDLPESVEGWNASSFLSGVSIKSGLVTYEYSETIKALLANPEVYGQVNLAIQARFKSSYALALYENCSRYRKIGITRLFDLDLFRDLMGVNEGTYQQFDQLNKRVITQAVVEINTASDIRVNPIFKRAGRRVIAIQFEIEEQKIMKRLGAKKTIESDVTTDLNISKNQLNKFIEEYGDEKVRKCIEYLENSPSYKAQKIKNIPGYLKTLLKEGNFNKQSSFTTIEQNDKPTARKKTPWQEQYEEILNDMNHWLMMADRVKDNPNKAMHADFQKMAFASEDKLKKHMEHRPKEKVSVV